MVKKASSLANQNHEDDILENEESVNPKNVSNQSKDRTASDLSTKKKKIISKKQKGVRVSLDLKSEGDNDNDEVAYCLSHPDSKVDFMCVNWNCLQELCAFCVLEHKEHINEIKPIKNIISEKLAKHSDSRLLSLKDSVMEGRSRVFQEFENLAEKLKNVLYEKIERFRNKLLEQETQNNESLSTLLNFKIYNLEGEGSKKNSFTWEGINILKAAMKADEKVLSSCLSIEENLITEQFGKLLN